MAKVYVKYSFLHPTSRKTKAHLIEATHGLCNPLSGHHQRVLDKDKDKGRLEGEWMPLSRGAGWRRVFNAPWTARKRKRLILERVKLPCGFRGGKASEALCDILLRRGR